MDNCSGIGVAGCGVYAHGSGAAWFGRMRGHLDLLPPLPDGAGEACGLYCSFPGPLQTVQRAEIWGVLVALQGCIRMHVGVDNLNVVRHVSRIIGGRCTGMPFSLVNDGDLLLQIQQLVFWRGVANAAVSKVKGHADESLVALGRIREVDRHGNNEADAAAAVGRRRVHRSVASAREVVTRSCARWYPVVRELHRFFIAIAGSVLNDDGMSGTTLHPVVSSAAANPKREKVEPWGGNLARLPGPVHLWASDWSQLPVACIGEGDIAAWIFSVGLLLKFVHFLGSFALASWCGVSYLGLLILYEKWAGERLVIEGAVPFARRVARPISVSAGRSCRFLESLIRFLALLPGGLFRCLPCHIGANYCRLRHLGWKKCGHGLTFSAQGNVGSRLFRLSA